MADLPWFCAGLWTIGYCYKDGGNDENLIAVVDRSDSLKIRTLMKLWKANTESEKIEIVNDQSGIECWNEWFVKKNYELADRYQLEESKFK